MPTDSSWPYRDASLPIADRVADLLGRMTRAEKVAQLGALWLNQLLDGDQFLPEQAQTLLGEAGIGTLVRGAAGGNLLPAQVAQTIAAAQHYLRTHTRLGIPAIVHDECCAGFMARSADVYPHSINLASTWNPALAEAETTFIRAQMRAVGVTHGLAPVLDVTRDPRWGRLEETFGEDPYLAAALGVAYIRGLQGPDLSAGVAATGKHFAAHGMPEAGLNWAPVHVGPRELREEFLVPFEAAVREAGLATIMNAYHELDGIPCGANRELLTDLLRGEWGFTGAVFSDYDTLPRLVDYHFAAADKTEAAALALAAGLDVELSRVDVYGEPLLAALASGRLDESALDLAVGRVLTLKFRLGLFETPSGQVGQVAEVFDQPVHRELARRIARQSIVLLKNDGGLLPLRSDLRSLAVIGPNAHRPRHMVGAYAYASMADFMDGGEDDPAKTKIQGKLPPMLSVLEAIQQQAPAGLQVRYAQGCDYRDPDRAGLAEAVALARSSDVAVLVVGGRSNQMEMSTGGETRDRATLNLPGIQDELVQAVLDTGTPVVLVAVDGRPISIPALGERIPAILEAWLPGEEGGPALAEIIFGQVNPSGKLPVTLARSVGQVPIYYRHKPSAGKSYNYNSYVDESNLPWFPFGHGLSYTQFEYTDLHISPAQAAASDEVTISLTVRNTGDRAGAEVVQLYVRDVVGSVTRPVQELKGFHRLELAPGEARTVTFTLAVAQLAFYNRAMQYVVEPGLVEIMLGSSSADIRLAGQFEIIGPVTPVARKVFFTQSTEE